MSTGKRFARNILSNTMGYFISIAVVFFLSPFVVRTLGDEIYGLWTLVVALTGYYGLLDLGVRAGVGQYVARYWATRDIDGVNRTMNTAFVLLACGAGVLMIITGILALLLPTWMQGSATDIRTAQIAMVIAGLGVSLQFPLVIYSTVAHARERFEVENAIGISTRLVSAGLQVWALKSGHGLVGLALAVMGTQLVGMFARMYAAYRLMPGLKWSPRLFSRSTIREFGGYGLWSFLLVVADRVEAYLGPIIIGGAVGATAITYYQIGANLIGYYVSIVLAVVWTITPYATKLDAKGDHAALRALLYPATRGVLLLSTLIAGGLFFLGHDFLAIWMGAKYVSGEAYTSSAVIMAILAISALIRYSQAPGRQILFGMRKVEPVALLAGIETVLHIVLTLVLVRTYGILGAAVANLIAVVLVYGIGLTYYVLKVLQADWRRYLWEAVLACVPAFGSMALMAWWTETWLVADSWGRLVLKGFLVVAPVPVVGFLFVLTAEQRRGVLRRFGLRRAGPLANPEPEPDPEPAPEDVGV